MWMENVRMERGQAQLPKSVIYLATVSHRRWAGEASVSGPRGLVGSYLAVFLYRRCPLL